MQQAINRILNLMLCAIWLVLIAQTTLAQTTLFTYQGKLSDSGGPANGNFDLQFKVFDDLASPPGNQQGPTVTVSNVAVTGGIFTVTLDFGTGVFAGANRFLEIAVRPAGGGAFTLLSPRQQVTSNPYAIKSLNAATADGLSMACVNCVTSSQISSVSGSQVSGAIPVASVPAGSASYVQNTTTQQATSNFNISGTGTANIFNAATQYNIGGNRVLSVAGTNNFFAGGGAGQSNTGTENSFVGRNAGQTNTTGLSNAFFGTDTGRANTMGSFNSFFGGFAGSANIDGGENSFFGYAAGRLNTSGSINSFFGKTAGNSNTTGAANSFFGFDAGRLNTLGNNNTFLGVIAGDTNTTGSKNTIIGSSAGVSTNNLNYATAIGADSVVSSSNTVVLGRNLDAVQIPGNLNVAGSFTGSFTVPATNITGILAVANGGTGLSAVGAAGNLLRSNGTAWTSAALQAADVPDLGASYLKNTTTPQAGSNFNISGNGTVAGTLTGNIVNATTQYNIGGNRVLSVAGTNNFFAGVQAGQSNTGTENSFAGTFAGQANTTGRANSFFGVDAGRSNTTGDFNSFFGVDAGLSNATGTGNSFFGLNAGRLTTSGQANSFFGVEAGKSNTTGSNNSFVGNGAGINNTEGFTNSFIGAAAGSSNTTGSSNSFFGLGAGSNNTVGSSNTSVGSSSNVSANNLTNATAIGAGAVVSSSNTVVLGRSTDAVQIPGALSVTGGTTFGGTLGANIFNATTQYNIGGNRILAGPAGDNVFAGRTAGISNTSGVLNSFFGHRSGEANIGGSSNSFFGERSGLLSQGINNSFFGAVAGQSNTTGGNNTIIGTLADVGAPNLSFATAIGAGAVVSSSNTVVLGRSTDTVQIPGPLDVTGRVRIGVLGSAFGESLAVGTVRLEQLGSAGSTSLCQNFSLFISTCSSSIRYKQNISPFNQGLSLIKQLRPVSFNWRANNQADFGLVAEEVNQVEPLLTTTNDKGEIEGVKYDRIGVVLVNAVQEQQRQIEAQQKQLDEQKQFIKKQEERLRIQQAEMESLRILVCSQIPTAETCRSKK